MAKQPKDIAASVRQRLLNLARAEGQLFDVVLVAFGLERLVYRLSVSEYRDRFVLKGGMLVTLWTADTGRFTRDIDFLAFARMRRRRARWRSPRSVSTRMVSIRSLPPSAVRWIGNSKPICGERI